MKSRPSALRDFTVDHRVWLLTTTALFIGAGAAGLAHLDLFNNEAQEKNIG
jgi:hypothetical protein